MASPTLAFSGVSLTVFWVAWIAFAILVLALFAASAAYFFAGVGHFDDAVREASMELSPAARRRFFEIYESHDPKNPAVAWFLAVLLGPFGVNVYRRQWAVCAGALLTLNGLGIWWLESWFTAPRLIVMRNNTYAMWARHDALAEFERKVVPLARSGARSTG